MNLSRVHMGMLSVVSIFTGMISPVIMSGEGYYPLPLTDMQILAYLVLVGIAFFFLAVGMGRWQMARICGGLIIIAIGYLASLGLSHQIHPLGGGATSLHIGGWIFLMAGVLLMSWSMIAREDRDDTHTFDRLIGGIGSMTILFLTALIVYQSYLPHGGSQGEDVLVRVFGTGGVESRSGVTLSHVYPSIDKLFLDRATDSVGFFVASGSTMVHMPDGTGFDRLPYAVEMIGDTRYWITASGEVIESTTSRTLGRAILPQDLAHSILMRSESGSLLILRDDGIHTLSGYTGGDPQGVVSTPDGEHHVWWAQSASGATIYHNGTPTGDPHHQIHELAISENGKSIMAYISGSDGSGYIMKNEVKTEKIGSGYIPGSLRMNGSHSIYAVDRDGAIQIIYDGSLIDRRLDEVREIYLEDDGTGYSYFGRPLGEKTYCLYTRFKGNLCGLSGYMNPKKGIDGSDILFAGLKDGSWNIYRNITPVVKNTGYSNVGDISHDYAFFDITNPSYYLFISATEDGYRLYKKGNWINGVWKDVGLDVNFGYDGKVMMPVQDTSGWRIIEF